MWVCYGSTIMAWLRKRASKESLITTSVLATRQLVWRIVGPENWLLVYPLHVYTVAWNQIMPSTHTYKYIISAISSICFQAFKMNRTLPVKSFSDSTGHHSRKRNCHLFLQHSDLRKVSTRKGVLSTTGLHWREPGWVHQRTTSTCNCNGEWVNQWHWN